MSGNASQALELEPLNGSLRTLTISTPVRKGLIKMIWEATDPLESMSPYFEYYYSKRLQRMVVIGHDGFQVKSHLDIASIAKRILSGATREEIFGEISSTAVSKPDVDNINYGIDMCASLLVMADIEFDGHPGISGSEPVPWKQGLLTDALGCYFRPQAELQSHRPKLGKVFTARNLSRMAGIEIRWTTNLADHLRLRDDDQAVYIFHCAGFLEFQKGLSSNPFPDSLLEETLDTLAILFPSSDKETTSWLKGMKDVDPQLAECGSLHFRQRSFENFSYWHDRLVTLKQVFDESSPRTISNWWYDRRNGVQWYTYWAAIFFFVVSTVLSVLQIVEGALQVYLAYQSA